MSRNSRQRGSDNQRARENKKRGGARPRQYRVAVRNVRCSGDPSPRSNRLRRRTIDGTRNVDCAARRVAFLRFCVSIFFRISPSPYIKTRKRIYVIPYRVSSSTININFQGNFIIIRLAYLTRMLFIIKKHIWRIVIKNTITLRIERVNVDEDSPENSKGEKRILRIFYLLFPE